MKAADLSLFVLWEGEEAAESSTCTGIICPLVTNPWPVVQVPEFVDAWRNGHPEEKFRWKLHPTIVRPYGDGLRARIRAHAFSTDVLTVRGRIDSVTPPLFLLPSPELTPTRLTVELEIIPPSVFFLSGYQCHLWLGTIGSIIWEGAWNAPDSKEFYEARVTDFQPGDAIPFMSRAQTVLTGVAILQQR